MWERTFSAGNGDEFGLDLERGEAVQRHAFAAKRLNLEGPYSSRFAPNFDPKPDDDGDQAVLLAQLGDLQARKGGLVVQVTIGQTGAYDLERNVILGRPAN